MLGLDSVDVAWEVATDEGFKEIYTSGITQATADKDYTVKVDVEGLKANKQYFYRFFVGNIKSAVGVTKTLASAMSKRCVSLLQLALIILRGISMRMQKLAVNMKKKRMMLYFILVIIFMNMVWVNMQVNI